MRRALAPALTAVLLAASGCGSNVDADKTGKPVKTVCGPVDN